MDMTNNNIAAVVVTFNPNILNISRQIESLINQVSYICYVDNNSDNITEIENVIEKYTNNIKIILIKNIDNYGLSIAQNIGIKYMSNLKAKDILILDHDSILDSNFCQNLLFDRNILLQNGINVASIGPIYYDEITNEQYPITKFHGPFIERIKIDTNPQFASFIIASGSLTSIKVFDKIGFFNEELFIDYIDVEWCFRAKSLGYQICVSPKANMKHSIGDQRQVIMGRSISIHSPLRRYYLSRNSIYMLKLDYISLGYKLREIVFNFLRISILVITQKNRILYLKYFLAGIVDGCLSNYGKCKRNY
jgi:rhamnosyltransferase